MTTKPRTRPATGPATAPGRGALAVLAVLLLVVALVVGGAATLVGFERTDSNTVALSYGGGPFEGRKYQGFHQPSSGLVFNGVLDRWFTYPSDQRNYIISKRQGEGDVANADSIVAPSKDGVPVEFEVGVPFKLNIGRDGVKLRKFHEELGRKYRAYGDGDGWDRFLLEYVRPAIQAAVQDVARDFTASDLYSSGSARPELEKRAAVALKDRLAVRLGDTYICGAGYTLTRPEECPDFTFNVQSTSVPEAIRAGFQRIQEATLAVTEAEQRARQQQIVAQAKVDEQRILASAPPLTPGQIRQQEIQTELECARRPGCTMILDRSGGQTNVNVDAAPRG